MYWPGLTALNMLEIVCISKLFSPQLTKPKGRFTIPNAPGWVETFSSGTLLPQHVWNARNIPFLFFASHRNSSRPDIKWFCAYCLFTEILKIRFLPIFSQAKTTGFLNKIPFCHWTFSVVEWSFLITLKLLCNANVLATCIMNLPI